MAPGLTTVHLVTLGCARNEVDSEELAARLEAGGFRLVDDPARAEAVLVNTCGFVEQAKKDSVDTLLAAADLKEGGATKAVVAVGCMAERYGRDLAESLPEADAVLGFDDYADIAARLNDILGGHAPAPHVPRDRRTLLPLAPADRQRGHVAVPGHQQDQRGIPSSGPRVIRRRLDGGPWAPLKIASGCDRRCAFCAIPAFRGAYLSRPADEVVTEARWLVERGVKEVLLVSENSSSYGKDLGDMRALEKLLVSLSEVDGLERIRVSYLQPAEVRPALLDAITSIDRVVPYFDLSFQHASPSVLRRMRRFGDPDSFVSLIDQIRTRAPLAGIRSNVIAGFPGETEADVEVLESFLVAARLDVVGVFGYSDEEDTEAVGLTGHLDEDEVEGRRARLADLVEELCAQRAEDRIGEVVEVIVESAVSGSVTGRAAHQGPEVDGDTTVTGCPARMGDVVTAIVTSSEGVDLHAAVLGK